MLEQFVRFANASAQQLPVASAAIVEPGRRAFLSEAAFVLAMEGRRGSRTTPIAAARLTVERSRWFSKGAGELTEVEVSYVGQLAQAMEMALDVWHLAEGLVPEEWEPEFSGAGIIDSGRGDVRCGGVLWEFKAADAGFHASDFRQLMTYCALNWASGGAPLHTLVLFNPRSGMQFVTRTADLARAAALATEFEVSAEIIRFATASGVSR